MSTPTLTPEDAAALLRDLAEAAAPATTCPSGMADRVLARRRRTRVRRRMTMAAAVTLVAATAAAGTWVRHSPSPPAQSAPEAPQQPMSLFPGCAAGGSIDLVGGKRTGGYPTVAATVGSPVTVEFRVADDNGGHVLSASAMVREPGTTLRTVSPVDLATADLALATESSGRSTLTFTPATPGRYPIFVHAVQSVSDACAKRAIAAGASNTNTVEYSIVGWVDAT